MSLIWGSLLFGIVPADASCRDSVDFKATCSHKGPLVTGYFASLTFIDQITSWRRHQMVTFSAFLVICAGNSPVPGEIPTHRPVTRSCDVFFDLRLNKRFSKQSWGWWFETLLRPLWRHRNDNWKWCLRSCKSLQHLKCKHVDGSVNEVNGFKGLAKFKAARIS